MKPSIKTLLAASALAMVPIAFGQNGEMAGAGTVGGNGILNSDVELPEEVAAIRDDLVLLREALAASRQAVIDGLDEDATIEERQAAIEAWRALEETQADIDEIRELNQELRLALQELGIVGGRDPIEVPEEIQAARDEMQALAQTLAESRRAVIDGLGEDATLEERQAALETWRAENAEAIADLAELRETVTSWARENRPDRGTRAGVSAHLRQRMKNFQEDAALMRMARLALRERLANATTEEERREILQQFRERYRNLMQERKELKRLERLAGSGVGGDRRPGG